MYFQEPFNPSEIYLLKYKGMLINLIMVVLRKGEVIKIIRKKVIKNLTMIKFKWIKNLRIIKFNYFDDIKKVIKNLRIIKFNYFDDVDIGEEENYALMHD